MTACTASCCLPIDAPRSTVLTRRVRRAAYVTVKSVRALFGVAEAALSLLVMPLPSRAQRRAGRELDPVAALVIAAVAVQAVTVAESHSIDRW